MGAVTNIVFDYLLIFGIGFFPEFGVAGAAIATVMGQILAAIIVSFKGYHKVPAFQKLRNYIKPIYKAGIPNIIMNALCTVYIVALNLILVSFSNDAVTVLGLYYKLQMFCLIPVMGLTTCIVPISVSLVIPTYFQAIGMGKQSIALTVLRQIGLLIPLAWIFSFIGLNYVWLAFPITEVITAAVGYILYRKFPMKEKAKAGA